MLYDNLINISPTKWSLYANMSILLYWHEVCTNDQKLSSSNLPHSHIVKKNGDHDLVIKLKIMK